MEDLVKMDRIDDLERLILEAPQVDLRTENVLNGKMLARTVYIPEGTVVTGATHKTDHISVVVGDVTVSTDEGTKRITGHCVFASKAGIRRAVVAHSFTVWTTICRTEKTDVQEAEDELVVESARLQTRCLELTSTQSAEKISF